MAKQLSTFEFDESKRHDKVIHLQPTSNSTKTFTLSEMVIESFSNRSVAVKRSSKKRSRANEDFELELTGLKCVSG